MLELRSLTEMISDADNFFFLNIVTSFSWEKDFFFLMREKKIIKTIARSIWSEI